MVRISSRPPPDTLESRLVGALPVLVHRLERRGTCNTLALTYSNATSLQLLDSHVKLIRVFLVEMVGIDPRNHPHEVGETEPDFRVGVVVA